MHQLDWIQWLYVDDSVRVRWDGRAACMRCPEESAGQFYLFNTRAVPIALCDDCAQELEYKRVRALWHAGQLEGLARRGQAVPTD